MMVGMPPLDLITDGGHGGDKVRPQAKARGRAASPDATEGGSAQAHRAGQLGKLKLVLRHFPKSYAWLR